jgi:hypothetical protein
MATNTTAPTVPITAEGRVTQAKQLTTEQVWRAVAPESWKAKHIATNGRVSVTVPIRRGGLLSLMLPIPPATISFIGTAIVHPAGWLRNSFLASHLAALLPPERRNSAAIIEVVPEGEFLIYGLGVSLTHRRRSVSQPGNTAGGCHHSSLPVAIVWRRPKARCRAARRWGRVKDPTGPR